MARGVPGNQPYSAQPSTLFRPHMAHASEQRDLECLKLECHLDHIVGFKPGVRRKEGANAAHRQVNRPALARPVFRREGKAERKLRSHQVTVLFPALGRVQLVGENLK